MLTFLFWFESVQNDQSYQSDRCSLAAVTNLKPLSQNSHRHPTVNKSPLYSQLVSRPFNQNTPASPVNQFNHASNTPTVCVCVWNRCLCSPLHPKTVLTTGRIHSRIPSRIHRVPQTSAHTISSVWLICNLVYDHWASTESNQSFRIRCDSQLICNHLDRECLYCVPSSPATAAVEIESQQAVRVWIIVCLALNERVCASEHSRAISRPTDSSPLCAARSAQSS